MLKSCWEQICELLMRLSYEPYIDGQLEIDEIWEICEALTKREDLGQEDWKLRKKILSAMIENDYYDYYGCSDPMSELAEKLCVTPGEYLEMADFMNKFEEFRFSSSCFRTRKPAAMMQDIKSCTAAPEEDTVSSSM